MKRAWAPGIAIVALGSVMLAAQGGRSGDVQMKAAQQKAEVEGDLKGAIEAYRKIVSGAGSNRALAAEALVRMAECHQKLGDAESRRIYEQVLHEYADQKDAAATAAARLADGNPNGKAGPTTRQVWTGKNVDLYGSVSPDGRFVSFTDWDTGDLALHNLATGEDRRLTGKKDWNDPAFAMGAAVSPDSRRLAYGWMVVSPAVPAANHFAEVRVIEAAGGAPRVLVADPDLRSAYVHDWSADGRWLAVELQRADTTAEIGVVSTADGALRVLKRVGRDAVSKVVFSPDGRYLAYDVGIDADSAQRETFLISADGGHETPALVHPANDRVLAWTADGRHVLVASDRSGSRGIWALPVRDGRPEGEPTLIKANINPTSLGLTRSGALYYGVEASSADMYVASADFDAGRTLAPPTVVPKPYPGRIDFPQWSPDGRSLAYLTRRDSNTRSTQMTALLIRSMDTGKVRQFRPDLTYLNANGAGPIWAPDGSFLVITASDKNGRLEILRIDARTGEAAPIVLARDADDLLQARAVSRDGRTLFLTRADARSNEVVLLARGIASGSEREIARRQGRWGRGTDVSPDGTAIAMLARDNSTRSTTLFSIPIDGGAPRELLHASSPESLIGTLVKWSPDGKSLLVMKDKGDGSPRTLWRVPATGGPARAVDLKADWVPFLGEPGHVAASFHPDGHQVAFVRGETRLELWALENFLPAAASAKR